MRVPIIALAALLSLACAEDDVDPCLCSVEHPGINIEVDWDGTCTSEAFSFGIRSEESILSLSTSRCIVETEDGKPSSVLFDWPDGIFDGDVVPLRHTTQGDGTISHGSDTFIARKEECVVKVLSPTCSSQP